MTLQELSHKAFYDMWAYSQLITDLIDEAEQDLEDMTEVEKGAKRYYLGNLLAVIDPLRIDDAEALNSLIELHK